jgi:hypothetical protein
MKLYKFNDFDKIYKLIQNGGLIYKFVPGDRFTTYNNDYGTIIRVAYFNEFHLNLSTNLTYYVVKFDNGNRKQYGGGVINVLMPDNTYNYIVEQSLIMPTTQLYSQQYLPQYPSQYTQQYLSQNSSQYSPQYSHNYNMNKCKFFIGEYVFIKYAILRLINPFRDELIINKIAKITKKHNSSPLTNPPYVCLYELVFDDGRIAPEVKEEYIEKINSNLINYTNPISPLSPINPNSLFLPKTSIPNTLNFNSYIIELMKLNNDDSDKKEVIKYYYKSILKLIDKDTKIKLHKTFLESHNGKKYIKKILKKYIDEYDSNWKEMKEIDNYDHVMKYLQKYIEKIEK